MAIVWNNGSLQCQGGADSTLGWACRTWPK